MNLERVLKLKVCLIFCDFFFAHPFYLFLNLSFLSFRGGAKLGGVGVCKGI
uniref:Uncharacterized protein n=1 Tax=Campylobacter fetus subsp. venerealis TaxID=32020 RepID=A4UD28_CAMFE|nr:hypothetical protein [Campylobacter fetus subsp. venerealis]